MKTLAIRVTDEDHALFVAVAGREDMPLSTLVRRQLRALAREHGLLVDALPAAAEPEKPRVIRRPIPQGVNAWRDEIYVRMNSGESAADVAESYGVSTQLVKDKYKAARDDRQYHADAGVPLQSAGAEPELVYAPADPDNPTPEELAISDEIAQKRLRDMGLL